MGQCRPGYDLAMATDDERRWVETWRRAGPELERIRNEELRNLDESAALRKIRVLDVPVELLPDRRSSINELAALGRRWVESNRVP